LCGTAIDPAKTTQRVISVISSRGTDVRYYPKSDRESDMLTGRYVPKADILRCDKKTRYSITLSAATIRSCGIVRPSALAVFRLTTRSNFVGRSTGKSADFGPVTAASALE
jgi:hypothetical protein